MSILKGNKRIYLTKFFVACAADCENDNEHVVIKWGRMNVRFVGSWEINVRFVGCWGNKRGLHYHSNSTTLVLTRDAGQRESRELGMHEYFGKGFFLLRVKFI